MFPGGMNPKNMSRMMRQMGIKTDELDAKSVEIKLNDGRKLVFNNPQIQLMEVQGQKTYTLIGTPIEEKEIPSEDIDMVSEQANVSKEKAKETLEECDGDIATAIEKLNKKE
ncbi:MAG: nascent polypeptide-associated complex protein [Candidatus ainarchaeum sp.]|nr:nascent polypeptide-associated complex protein [Candidatus ainarchaeum sp.]